MGLFDLFTDKKKSDRIFFGECSRRTSKNPRHFDSKSEEINQLELKGPGSPHLCVDTVLENGCRAERMGRTHWNPRWEGSKDV